MSPDKRRNSMTAVCFLLCLYAASFYLGLGTLPKAAGFRKPDAPGHALQVQPAADKQPSRPEPPAQPVHPAHVPRQPLKGEMITAPPAPSPEPEAKLPDAPEDFTRNAEAQLNALLDRDHGFIELYGLSQRLMLRQVVEDQVEPKYTVVRLDGDVLTFAQLEPERVDMTVRAREMTQFAQRVRRRFRIPVLYVQAPSKLDMAPLPEGIVNYADEEADQFLSLLNESGSIDTLDLRTVFRARAQQNPEALGKLFFHTDHHWTPAGAFLGFQTLCGYLEEHYGFSVDAAVTDPLSYDKYMFDAVFLGSQGKRVGSLYAGVDGIEIWSPDFETDFTYTVSGNVRTGPFAASLLYPEMLASKGLYDTNPYVLYSGGDHFLGQAVNEALPDGKRILIFRDSFGCALTPFLALAAGEVDAMDPRAFNGDWEEMMKYIKWLDPDMLIVMNTTSSLSVDALYPYLPSARRAVLAERAEQEQEQQTR